jgi:hypothetical protein
MHTSRRTLLRGLGGALALPALESTVLATTAWAAGRPADSGSPLRFLVVGNPLGMHPPNFFPKDFGKDYTNSRTLKPLESLG